MAYLINSTADLQAHLAVPGSLDWDLVLPSANKAERKYILPLIGAEELEEIASANSGVGLKVKVLLSESVANFVLLMAMPILAVKISSVGINSIVNSETKPADWREIRDLKRSFQESAYSALNDALKIMEENHYDFQEWSSSDLFTIFKDLIVNRTDIFNKWFSINSSRRTFLAIKQHLYEVEEEYLQPLLGDETLALLKADNSDVIVKKVQTLMQAAAVNFAMVKVADTTVFQITESGLIYSWESLPGEKKQLVPDAALFRLKESRDVSARNYISKAIALIVANPTKFPDYTENENEYSLPMQKLKSGLAL